MSLKLSAILQLLIGTLLLVFGIVRQITFEHYQNDDFASAIGMGMWVGGWVMIVGLTGVATTSLCLRNNEPHPVMVYIYMAFSIAGSLIAGAVVICYGIVLAYGNEDDCKRMRKSTTPHTISPHKGNYDPKCKAAFAMNVSLVVFAFVEFCIGFWSAQITLKLSWPSLDCSCIWDNCCVCIRPKIVYLMSPGYVVHKDTDGNPIAVPVLPGSLAMDRDGPTSAENNVQQGGTGRGQQPPTTQDPQIFYLPHPGTATSQQQTVTLPSNVPSNYTPLYPAIPGQSEMPPVALPVVQTGSVNVPQTGSVNVSQTGSVNVPQTGNVPMAPRENAPMWVTVPENYNQAPPQNVPPQYAFCYQQTPGYVATQGPDGTHIAVPVQTGNIIMASPTGSGAMTTTGNP